MFARKEAKDNSKIDFRKLHKYTNAELIDYGEPFVFDRRSLHHNIPLIRLLGPGHYWQYHDEGSGLLIIGHAIDGHSGRDNELVLDTRRLGDVYGRWYSEFCVEGELGITSYGQLTEISLEEFEDLKTRMVRADQIRNGIVIDLSKE